MRRSNLHYGDVAELPAPLGLLACSVRDSDDEVIAFRQALPGPGLRNSLGRLSRVDIRSPMHDGRTMDFALCDKATAFLVGNPESLIYGI